MAPRSITNIISYRRLCRADKSIKVHHFCKALYYYLLVKNVMVLNLSHHFIVNLSYTNDEMLIIRKKNKRNKKLLNLKK